MIKSHYSAVALFFLMIKEVLSQMLLSTRESLDIMLECLAHLGLLENKVIVNRKMKSRANGLRRAISTW